MVDQTCILLFANTVSKVAVLKLEVSLQYEMALIG